MATAVIGGLLTSTALSLLVVPVVFTYINGIEQWFARRMGRRRRIPFNLQRSFNDSGNRISSRFAPAGVALVLSMAAGAASAEEATEEQSPWRVVLGAGVQSRPEYVGSDKDEVQVLPVVNIQYGRFFLGGVPGGGGGMGGGLGAHLFQNDTWDFGAIVTGDLDKPREEQ